MQIKRPTIDYSLCLHEYQMSYIVKCICISLMYYISTYLPKGNNQENFMYVAKTQIQNSSFHNRYIFILCYVPFCDRLPKV